ncbi:MAG: FAD-dependent oxidoreductase [Desulfuromonadales bacterium]|nr:FAD-dependent oxidoreductase [Desulfuromonadales bacterium]
MSKEKLVVIGGDAAGMSAASQAKRRRPELAIVVIERSPHTSFSACGIPYYVGRVVDAEEKLIIRTPEKFRELDGIDVRVLHEVEKIDVPGKKVHVRNLKTGRSAWEPYDQLLIATGAVPFCPQLPGADAVDIFGVSTLESGLEIRRRLDKGGIKKAVVVGGGYIGLEMAEALVMNGLEVSLISRPPQVMGTLDDDMGALVSQALRDVGVTLYLEEELTSFKKKAGKVTGIVTDKRTLLTDIVILGLGVRPNTALAAAAGIPLGEKGSIRVNERMETGIAGIWAAGDCAESFHLVSRKPFYVALGTVANRQGRVAGINLGGGYATFPGVVGTAVTKICTMEVARTGLQEKELRKLGIEWVSAVIKSRTKAGYYPDAGEITVKVLAERGSGRLLGGQIVGMEGSAKRIDTLATALHAGFTVEEMINLDLGYAPPFSPVWDPVVIAAREAAKKL